MQLSSAEDEPPNTSRMLPVAFPTNGHTCRPRRWSLRWYRQQTHRRQWSKVYLRVSIACVTIDMAYCRQLGHQFVETGEGHTHPRNINTRKVSIELLVDGMKNSQSSSCKPLDR